MAAVVTVEGPAATRGRPAGAVPAWLRRRLARAHPAWWGLAGMVAVWAAVFGRLVWLRHERFMSAGFDLGIFDQATWLMSRFGGQFITVRGLPVFGHHAEPAMYLFVPFYWVGGGPHLLNLTQVGAMALGAVPLFLVARDRLADAWTAVALAAAFLLHPALQFMAWELFHPEVVAITPLFLAYWFSLRRRWGWFAASAVLAAAWKEDVALAVAVLGVLVALRGDRRVGLLTAGLSLGWFAFVNRLLLPAVSGEQAFYNLFFGDLGASPAEIAWNAVVHPTRLLDRLLDASALRYAVLMVLPFGLVPVAAPLVAAVALPSALVNVLSVVGDHRSITYHYSAMVLAGLALATVEGVRRATVRLAPRRALAGLVATSALAATVLYGPSPLGVQYREGWWPLDPDPRHDAKRQALATVPPDAPVSATYNLVPHLTHRRVIYEWPVPFGLREAREWGVAGEGFPPAVPARWIVLDRQALHGSGPIAEDLLATGRYVVVFDRDDVLVARAAQ
jgi:uncharacterized membrane protein